MLKIEDTINLADVEPPLVDSLRAEKSGVNTWVRCGGLIKGNVMDGGQTIFQNIYISCR